MIDGSFHKVCRVMSYFVVSSYAHYNRPKPQQRPPKGAGDLVCGCCGCRKRATPLPGTHRPVPGFAIFCPALSYTTNFSSRSVPQARYTRPTRCPAASRHGPGGPWQRKARQFARYGPGWRGGSLAGQPSKAAAMDGGDGGTRRLAAPRRAHIGVLSRRFWPVGGRGQLRYAGIVEWGPHAAAASPCRSHR